MQPSVPSPAVLIGIFFVLLCLLAWKSLRSRFGDQPRRVGQANAARVAYTRTDIEKETLNLATHTDVPAVLVSSTFYDLQQVRDDLRRFLDDLGYRALVSEHASFPIEPDATTVENCQQRVLEDADLLVLVIGKRYGSLDRVSQKSVTNLEYLAARSKRIPIFAFVESGLVELLGIWKANPSADFSAHVDTPQLFEFLETVRTHDSVWTLEFKYARDIIDALRIQFAYQQNRGLALQRSLRSTPELDWANTVRGNTLRLLLERPKGWEYLFFASALGDAVGRHSHLRWRHAHNLPIGPGEDVPKKPLRWIRRRFDDGQRLATSINSVFEGPLQTALGPDVLPNLSSVSV